MNYEDEVVQKLIEKLVTVQRDSKEEMSLDSVAYEIGLSQGDLKIIKDQIKTYIKSGDRYLKNDCYQDAVMEYEKALALNPFDPEILYKVANGYKFLWIRTKRWKHQSKAVATIKKCLEISPEYNEGYQMLGYLREQGRVRNKQNTRYWIFMGIFTAIAVFLLVMSQLFPEEPRSGENKDSSAVERSVSSESSSGYSSSSTQALPLEKVEVIFKESDYSTGFEFFLQRSKLNVYSDSFSYELKGALINDRYEVDTIQVHLTWFDQAGVVIYENFYELLYGSDPNIRPGESVPVDILEYEEDQDPPNISYAELEVYYLEANEAPENYDTMPVLDYQWKAGSKNHELIIYQRSSELRGGGEKSYNYIEYVIENTGKKPIVELVLLTEWFNQAGKLIDSEKSIAVSSNDASIMSGQKQVYREIGSFPADIDLTGYRYRVSVVEIE